MRKKREEEKREEEKRRKKEGKKDEGSRKGRGGKEGQITAFSIQGHSVLPCT